jgi:hypothetical protein
VRRCTVYTIAGIYYRRTLWQWLTRKPRQLAKFRIMDVL